jgi:hypothetical protein
MRHLEREFKFLKIEHGTDVSAKGKCALIWRPMAVVIH